MSSNTLINTDGMQDPMQLDTEGFEAFGFLTSEIFDPALFSNFGLNLGPPLTGNST